MEDIIITDKWNTPASDEILSKTASSLKANGINPVIVNTRQEAKEKVLALLPIGAEVMNMTSQTLTAIGIVDEIKKSGRYNSIHNTILSLDKETQLRKMKELRSVPNWAIGSVHAVTEDGQILIASGTGSQIPAYAYGANHVIWVVGTQKIVKDIDEGIKRIYEHSLSLESERINALYGGTGGSSVNRILIVTKESVPERTTMILVKEMLGF